MCREQDIKNTKLKEYIQRVKLIHIDDNGEPLYNYHLITVNSFKTTHNKNKIECKIHGIFLQSLKTHFEGNGCPMCQNSKGEMKIKKYLMDNNIKYEPQKRFKDCRDKKPLPFDFYLPDYNMCIEFDGEQHFKPVRFYNMSWEHAEKAFQRTVNHDNIKNEYCKNNNIKLIRISYINIKNVDIILNNLLMNREIKHV